jgi:hypothetical protein
LSNEEKTNDYENCEKGMIYMKNLKKRGGRVVEKRGEEETKSMPHAPVIHVIRALYIDVSLYLTLTIQASSRLKRSANHLWNNSDVCRKKFGE